MRATGSVIREKYNSNSHSNVCQISSHMTQYTSQNPWDTGLLDRNNSRFKSNFSDEMLVLEFEIDLIYVVHEGCVQDATGEEAVISVLETIHSDTK